MFGAPPVWDMSWIHKFKTPFFFWGYGNMYGKMQVCSINPIGGLGKKDTSPHMLCTYKQ